jgi:hypothetical protein
LIADLLPIERQVKVAGRLLGLSVNPAPAPPNIVNNLALRERDDEAHGLSIALRFKADRLAERFWQRSFEAQVSALMENFADVDDDAALSYFVCA